MAIDNATQQQTGNVAPASAPAPVAAANSAPAPVAAANTAPAPAAAADSKRYVPSHVLVEARQKAQEYKQLYDSQAAELEALKQRVADLQMQPQVPAYQPYPPQPVYQQPYYPQQPAHQPQPQVMYYDPQTGAPVQHYAPPQQAAPQQNTYEALAAYDRINTGINMQMQALKSNPRFADAAQYEGEIRSLIGTVPLQQRVDNNLVETMYYLVKGRAVVSNPRMPSAPPPVMPNSGSSAIPGSMHDPNSLSEDEMTIAQKMGISPEDYAKYRR